MKVLRGNFGSVLSRISVSIGSYSDVQGLPSLAYMTSQVFKAKLLLVDELPAILSLLIIVIS